MTKMTDGSQSGSSFKINLFPVGICGRPSASRIVDLNQEVFHRFRFYRARNEIKAMGFLHFS